MKKDKFMSIMKDSKSRNVFEDSMITTKKRIVDSYNNKLLGLGKEDKRSKYEYWDLSNDSNNWHLWLAMYNNSWMFRKAIDKPSQDIVNLPLKFIGDVESDKLGKIKKDLSKLKFQLIQLLMWGSLFGGSVGIMLFDKVPLDKMIEPLSKEKIQSTKSIRLFILDRWMGISPSRSEVVTDITDVDFLKPRYYEVQLGKERYKIHHSYVLRYEHRVAPNLLRNGELSGWGFPEGVHLVNELMRDEKLKNSISSLIDKSLIEIIKMPGMRGVFMGSDQDNERQLTQRLEMVNWGRNFNSLTFLDKDDEYQQNEFSGLSGLSDLMDKNMETISAALDMTGVLFGDMSGGFSPDNYALVRYDTTIRNRAESYFRPILEKLLKVLKIKNDIDAELEFEFDTMIQVREEDGLDKMSKVVSILSSMISDGYMSVENAAKEVMKISKEVGFGESITEESLKEIHKDDEQLNEYFNERE